MSDVNLTKAVRSNLMSLQSVASMMAKTQDRLSTGNKVNSALDNPTNFFTASSLNSRAGDLNSLMDSMANGIKTLEAADNGLSSITKNLESMTSTLRQARQDKSFLTASYNVPKTADTALGATDKLSLSGGALATGATVDIDLTKPVTTAGEASVTWTGPGGVGSGTGAIAFTATVDGAAQTISISQAEIMAGGDGDNVIDSAEEFGELLGTQITGVDVEVTGNTIKLTSQTTGAASSVDLSAATVTPGTTAPTPLATPALLGMTATITGTPGTATTVNKTTDELVNEINNNATLKGAMRASNDNGKLRIENQSTQELVVGGVNVSGNVDGTSSGTSAAKIGGNTVRADLAAQFNELRDQLDKISDDASFNGINLLRGDQLKITFNETGTSSISIATKGEKSVNSTNLALPTTIEDKQLDSDASIDAFLTQVKTALTSVRAQASAFGSNLSIVQNRQDFTKSMINTLETGAGNLTLADMNEEAANMMALQTRQSLASSTLSMANQADQGVLQLLR